MLTPTKGGLEEQALQGTLSLGPESSIWVSYGDDAFPLSLMETQGRAELNTRGPARATWLQSCQ